MAKGKKPKRAWFYLKGKTKQVWAINYLQKAETQYMAARTLWFESYMWESTFFMMQALENLIKALYIQTTKHDIGLNLQSGNFKLTIRSKTPGAPRLNIHPLNPYINEVETCIPGFRSKIKTYFKEPGKRNGKYLLPTFFEKYQQGSRYPQKKKISIPFDIIHTFDEMFFKTRSHFCFSNDAEKICSPLQTLIEDIPDPAYPHEFFRDHLSFGETGKVFKNNKFLKPAPSLEI